MEPVAASDAERPPVWAGDISRALRQISQPQHVATVSTPSAPAPAMPHVVTVYRGSDSSADQGATQTAAAGNGTPPLPALPVAK
jgi:pilus assembly protein CpaB